jgi:hypothetical protein
MSGLTTELLSRACRTFFALAYPEGPAAVPPHRHRYLAIAPDQHLEPLLTAPDVCERLAGLDGATRGYALRLGSARFPHVKLQVIFTDPGCLFAVDTHDALRCSVSAAEAEAWRRLQAENRRLKEAIEAAWEKDGLLTFNALLRRGLLQ